MMALRRPRTARLFVAICLLLTLAGVTARFAGTWLLVTDPLQPARAIVVLGGHLPFRAIEAAALYRDKQAPEVWVTQGAFTVEDAALADLQVERTGEHVYSVEVLKRLAVPASAIRVLPDHDVNTADEIRTIARALRAEGATSRETRNSWVNSPTVRDRRPAFRR